MSAATGYDKKQDEQIKDLQTRLEQIEARDKGPEPLCELGYHWSVEQSKCIPDTPTPEKCGKNPDPDNIHIKEGGWGGNMSAPGGWTSEPMKDDPSKYKVIDRDGVNIAHNFASEAEADKYIAYYVCMDEAGGPDEVPAGTEPPKPPPSPPAETAGSLDGPYEIVPGSIMDSTTRGPTTRHYASGKPDDRTIEKNVKGIKYDNYQWVCYVTMHSIEHDDNVSVKFGGIHQPGPWWDCGISIERGRCCLGSEPRHPSTKLCIVKGKDIGSLIEKKLGIAGVFRKKENKIELWSKLEGEDKWTKQLEGVDVGGLKPNSAINEAQLRIDGFDEEPTIHSAKISEIKV